MPYSWELRHLAKRLARYLPDGVSGTVAWPNPIAQPAVDASRAAVQIPLVALARASAVLPVPVGDARGSLNDPLRMDRHVLRRPRGNDN